jgi:hypothetical protein
MKSLPMLATAAMLSSRAACTPLPETTTQATRTCPDASGAEIGGPFSRFSEAWATLEPTIVTALFTDETDARNHAIAASESGARS